MRQILWLALMPLMAFWVYSLGIYSSSTDLTLAAISLIIGVIISTIGLLNEETTTCRCFALIALPTGFACFFIPHPYNAGLIIITLAMVIYSIKPDLKALWLGMLFSGVVLSIQMFFLSIYYILAPSFHKLTFLSSEISFLFNIIGVDAASEDGIIFIYGLEKTFPFTVTVEKLGIYPWFLMFIGAIFLVFLSTTDFNGSWRTISKIFLIGLLYIILRYIFLVGLFFATDMPQYASTRLDIFIESNWLLVSFLPLILIFYCRYPIEGLRTDLNLKADRRLAAFFLMILIGSFIMLGAFLFQDPGIEKEGRVLVDEIHSVWEFSTLKLDENWYGESSTYNAYSMVEWLRDNYHTDRIVSNSYNNWSVPGATKVLPDLISDEITYDILKNYDILIIKTPTSYEPAEVDAIVRFVQNGGGLLLIGDHTNFGGSSTNLNQIAGRFGLRFGFDAVNTQEGRLFYYKRGFLPHSCLKYMPSLDFMTGCSIEAPVNSEPVILGFGLNAMPGEYSSTGFFRETRQNDPTQITDTCWGLFYQAVALDYGKGRIVAFSDSTVISNFRFFFGGTANFIAGVMEYLNHSNSLENEKLILFILGILMGIPAIYLLRKGRIGRERRFAVLVVIVIICALSASVSIWLFSIPSQSTIPSRFYDKDHTVAFDGEHSSPIVGQGDLRGDYETFFVWTQRLNMTPTVEADLDEAMKKGRFLVIIDPIEPISAQDREALLEYVEEGNCLLLLINSRGTGYDLMRAFNLSTYLVDQPARMPNTGAIYNNSMGLPISSWGLSIKGGYPLLNTGDRVVLAMTDHGKGSFVLFVDSHIFKDGFYGKPGYMGYSGSNPAYMSDLDYNMNSLYKLEFYMFQAAEDKNNSFDFWNVTGANYVRTLIFG